ncbi:DNA invertase Pin-like site-specific DNA recombinase [Amycolatopsis roodepoortensis]|uniref:DNA invertase Pin-like site-specific DNA recombinase n=1 Tax=Amycolatopsis roodepoortensis TaxID=700274 RepID=A0ABR9KX75_9PSEU|nr:DNA invertase Pin-like site-specific DNA recombinase [Amycolatopsis roodepoortensis]
MSGDLEPHMRAGLKQWLSDARRNHGSTLVVSSLTGWSGTSWTPELAGVLRARGKRLIAIAEGIDSSNSMAEFISR